VKSLLATQELNDVIGHFIYKKYITGGGCGDSSSSSSSSSSRSSNNNGGGVGGGGYSCDQHKQP
jgi:hypothetical protein